MLHYNQRPLGAMHHSGSWGGHFMGERQHVPHYHGFCRSCCHPVSKCCCGLPECRKVAKELLVRPSKAAATDATLDQFAAANMASMLKVMTRPTKTETTTGTETGAGTDTATAAGVSHLITNLHVADLNSSAALDRLQIGRASDIIGGGCCVHLSIEYMPSQAAIDVTGTGTSTSLPAIVVVYVIDSEATVLGWGKLVPAGYHIKEGIITTKPGAQLLVVVLNAIARVRWCEVFSC